MKDICPIKLVRCDTADVCQLFHCARDQYAKPVSDNQLSKQDHYRFTMNEQKGRSP